MSATDRSQFLSLLPSAFLAVNSILSFPSWSPSFVYTATAILVLGFCTWRVSSAAHTTPLPRQHIPATTYIQKTAHHTHSLSAITTFIYAAHVSLGSCFDDAAITRREDESCPPGFDSTLSGLRFIPRGFFQKLKTEQIASLSYCFASLLFFSRAIQLLPEGC